MAVTEAVDRVPRGTVRASLNFFVPPADGAQPYHYVERAPEGEQRDNYTYQAHEVDIEDIRGREAAFAGSASLDRHAFAVVPNVFVSAEADFVDDASIRQNYYPEVEALLRKNIPGSNKVVIFDHTIRRPGSARTPVTTVHIDQSAASAALRVHRHLPADEAAKLLQGRYRIINVWRPLNETPVESFPLAFASSASVVDEDVVPVEHRYPTEIGYVGQTAAVRHRAGQKWYYLSGMTGNERLLLECFDSEGLKPNSGVDGGRLAHTAFVDPRSVPDAEDRASIEVRTLVFGP